MWISFYCHVMSFSFIVCCLHLLLASFPLRILFLFSLFRFSILPFILHFDFVWRRRRRRTNGEVRTQWNIKFDCSNWKSSLMPWHDDSFAFVFISACILYSFCKLYCILCFYSIFIGIFAWNISVVKKKPCFKSLFSLSSFWFLPSLISLSLSLSLYATFLSTHYALGVLIWAWILSQAKPSQMRMYTYIAAGGKQINVELKKQ